MTPSYRSLQFPNNSASKTFDPALDQVCSQGMFVQTAFDPALGWPRHMEYQCIACEADAELGICTCGTCGPCQFRQNFRPCFCIRRSTLQEPELEPVSVVPTVSAVPTVPALQRGTVPDFVEQAVNVVDHLNALSSMRRESLYGRGVG